MVFKCLTLGLFRAQALNIYSLKKNDVSSLPRYFKNYADHCQIAELFQVTQCNGA